MIRKIVSALAIFIGLLLLSAILIPLLFKGKITALVKEEINKNLEATVDFSSVNLSFFKKFPSLSLTINDLSVAGKEEFEKDTLAALKEITVGVNFWTVITGNQISINSIFIDKPRISIIVLENGKANYLITKEDTSATGTEEPAAFKINLKEYSVKDGWLSYDDAPLVLK